MWLILIFYMLEEAITILFRLFGGSLNLTQANKFSTLLLLAISGIIILLAII